MAEQPISLLELQRNIQHAVRNELEMHYWVIAEISDFNVNYRGHCYLSLVEKDKNGDKIKAKARGIIWASRYRMLSAYFQSGSGESMKAGIKVMVKVTVDYHELYGLSLQIIDIDPTYTLGDIERRRREIIQQLEDAGIMEMNKTLDPPLLIQNIAVISSDTAAGFGDFVAQMETNSKHYDFKLHLFKAAMQGVDTEKTVIKALEAIYNAEIDYDVVIIIRGGGSRTDLAAFDNFEIASNIAQFPIPVLSGIGHERDASVVDLVAFKHLKTPTAVAEFILEHTEGLEESLDYELNRLLNVTRLYIENQEDKLNRINTIFIPTVRRALANQSNQLNFLASRLHRSIRNNLVEKASRVNQLEYRIKSNLNALFKSENHNLNNQINRLQSANRGFINSQNIQLDKLEQYILSNDPKRLLEKGYSLTTKNGKRIDSIKSLNKGETIKTWFKDGTVDSEIL
ncbi:MAG: exodeoxyribonuclease VII large subunit [Bacteroidota bacterium]|nr:exodeoxyribonuclease VII large subunit [Bacteroidota bacterium]